MKKLLGAFAFAAAALAFAAPAQAQIQGLYGNVGYTHFDLEDVEVGGITGRAGWQFSPHFGVEGEASLGVFDDDSGNVNVELDNAVAVYGTARVPVMKNLEVFGRLGYASVEIDTDGAAAGVGGDDDGVAFGGGVQYMISERFGVRGDYTRLEGDDEGIDTFGVSGVVKF